MSNTVFENNVLEAKLTELMDSKLRVRGLMTVDDSLTQSAGLTKTINRYTYNGTVETLAEGEANSSVGEVTFVPEEYTVKRYQQTFRYSDIEAMKDPAVIDMALAGIADVMSNQIRGEYFDELLSTRRRHAYAGEGLTYGDVVDALSEIGREVEDGLFIIMSAACRGQIRRDPDFVAARQGEVVYTGQFGTLCGLPVLFSKKVPEGKVIITDKAAVKFFVKREAALEQDRDIETKVNTVVYERHGIIALVDDTSTVILGPGAKEMTASYAAGKITATATAEGSLFYRIGAEAPLKDEEITAERGWNSFKSGDAVVAASGEKIAVCEADASGKCVASAEVVA